MKRLLITGGTVFVSKYAATWFSAHGYDVYVLNRGNHAQPAGTKLICADRHLPGDTLKDIRFDAVLDITAYRAMDIRDLLDHLGGFQDYIFISSSAVYPETLPQPFQEDQQIGQNTVWGDYGLNKASAEQYLLCRVPDAYVLRPPYLYGPMQNLYREPFVFDCARAKRPFFIPNDGKMPLQFFHVEDLCKLIELILNHHPRHHIMNVGNDAIANVNQFVKLCYDIAGTDLRAVYVREYPNQRDYFCFYDYGYVLNVERQNELLPDQKDLEQGLRESYTWYVDHGSDVIKKDYMRFIDTHFSL